MKNVIEEVIDDEPANLMTMEEYFDDAEQAEHSMTLAAFAHFQEKQHARMREYVQSTVSRYSPDDFHMHFRMSRTTVEILMGEIASSMSRCVSQSLEGKVLSSLWFLCTRESYREVGDKFGIDRGRHRIVMEFCKSVCNLSPRYIAGPSEVQAERIMTTFENKTGFPQVLGCIDGTHIDIKGKDVGGSCIDGTHIDIKGKDDGGSCIDGTHIDIKGKDDGGSCIDGTHIDIKGKDVGGSCIDGTHIDIKGKDDGGSCIDGTHIDIKGKDDGGSYINRKGSVKMTTVSECV
ncbi:uncharacterized protein LOC124268152 [Haliotis rubra]|uniref:uncharacterized protein LOC124268152 n=1 Tax=Haliotis rubra TaxID=36100 RepID=UPI001EE5D50B|nr:uncharacterized protein LOC124268152 [Haliotis rubra]